MNAINAGNQIRIECITCGMQLLPQGGDESLETQIARFEEFWYTHRAHTRRVTTDDIRKNTRTVEDFIPRSSVFPCGAYATIHSPLSDDLIRSSPQP